MAVNVAVILVNRTARTRPRRLVWCVRVWLTGREGSGCALLPDSPPLAHSVRMSAADHDRQTTGYLRVQSRQINV